MQRSDLVGSLVIIAFGGFAISQAVGLEYWSQFGPGPGFIPLWASIIIVLGGVIRIIQGFIKGFQEVRTISAEAKKHLFQVFAVAALTVMTVFSVNLIGFSVPTFIFSFSLVRWIGQHNLRTTLIYSICISAAFYLSFVVALSVPLPKGVLGF